MRMVWCTLWFLDYRIPVFNVSLIIERCIDSVLMRTAVVKETGGQRPELRITEDLEFWAYLAMFGKWGFIPEVLFVSDGGAVTRKKGWWAKNYERWKNAPTISIWETRIIAKNPELLSDMGYLKSKGRIAKNLAYAALLSKRCNEARKMIIENSNNFPLDKLSKLLVKCAHNRMSMNILSLLLRVREKNRKV